MSMNKRSLTYQVNTDAKRPRKRQTISLEVKLNILKCYEDGERVSKIAASFGLPLTTISTIIKNKEKIRASAQHATRLSSVKICRSRNAILENMERLLSIWIEEQNQKRVPINTMTIQEKAKTFYNELKEKYGCSSKDGETFIASRGWFDRFKRRHNLLKKQLVFEPAEDSAVDSNIDEVAVPNAENPETESSAAFNCLAYMTEIVIQEGKYDAQFNDFGSEKWIPTSCEPNTSGNAGDIPSADNGLMESNYVIHLKEVIENGGYIPQQVFAVDEIGLYWKRIPFCSSSEESIKCASKDKLTLLLGSNVEGDFKIKPMLVYHTENPKAMEGYSKGHLPVIWRSNKKISMTASVFSEWFSSHFCPAIKNYCASNNIEYKALLLLDESPGHPKNLNDFTNDVRVEYLPKNVSSHIQPMEQGTSAIFKALYLRTQIEQLARGINGNTSAIPFRNVWEDYNIVQAINNIATCWDEIRPSTINATWRKVWPEAVHYGYSNLELIDEEITTSLASIRRDILTTMEQMGFEGVEDDVIRILESHDEPLPARELNQATPNDDDSDDGEEVTGKQLKLEHMEKAFQHIEEAIQIFEQNDPALERSYNVSRQLRNALSCYKELYSEKQKRNMTTKKFL